MIPAEVIGIEVYTHVAEFPAEYNMTQAPGAGVPNCLTLIWTK